MKTMTDVAIAVMSSINEQWFHTMMEMVAEMKKNGVPKEKVRLLCTKERYPMLYDKFIRAIEEVYGDEPSRD